MESKLSIKGPSHMISLQSLQIPTTEKPRPEDQEMNDHLVKSAKLALLFILVAMSRADGKTDNLSGEFRNTRRGGTNMGLFPFPRVGRSDPSLGNAYGELHEMKRQGLIPFPRVGRGDMKPSPMIAPWLLADTYSFHKRSGGSGDNVHGGMWFGPRLGKFQKRSFEDADAPWTLVAIKEPSFKQNDFASRVSPESDEDNDDTLVEEVLSRRLDSKTRTNVSQ